MIYGNAISNPTSTRRLLKKCKPFRNNLPASESRDKITKLVESNAVVVLSGETGCGKSTQVPQFILEHAIFNQKGGETNIICTQPRRIIALLV